MANTFLRKFSNDLGTSFTAVGNYTVGPGTGAILLSLSLANTFQKNVRASVVLNDGEANYYLVKDTLIPGNTSLVAIGGEHKVVLQPGDSIQVSATGTVDATMSVMETPDFGISIIPSVNVEYLSIKDINVTPANEFSATNSVDGGNNTNITFV